jgi:glycine/D-amino acid oxidase-like deaminating enzyme
MYDFIVVGAGIAGLAIAELLQRSGRAVLLLEAESKICAQASAQQQGWFHTGALYAAMPSSRFFRQLVGNLDDLLNYYGCFPDMNLMSGRYLLTRRQQGWFRNSTNYYFYASPRDPSLRGWQKLVWRLAILRAQSRLSWFETLDFNKELSPQFTPLTVNLNLVRSLSQRTFDFAPGIVGKVFKSRDRTFNAEWITGDLLRAFQAGGGTLALESPAARIERGCVSCPGATHRGRNIIVAAGRDIEPLTGVPVNVHKSPLLVVRPALTDVNFVWMTMTLADTFNHLFHQSEAGQYSVIGNATYFAADATVDEAGIKRRLLDRAAATFHRTIDDADAALYFGYKTEVQSGKLSRNYQYHIVDGRDCVVALPGKMSLAFSLAVNVCRHFGIDPVTDCGHLGDADVAPLIDLPDHLKQFLRLRS